MTVGKPNNRTRERGAAIVEFALVAPVLIMIMMGIVQLGLLLHQQQAIHASAREGARQGSFPGATESDIEAAVASALTGINLDSAPVVTITPNDAAGNVRSPYDGTHPCDENDAASDSVTVNVQVATTLDIPFLAGQNINLIGEGTFKCEFL